jgi:oxygen-dependent protoporphyrinogen oxidase
MEKPKKRIAIVGMGISGLHTALSLVKSCPWELSEFVFFDKNSKLGGVLSSLENNGFLLEEGAQGVLLSRAPFVRALETCQMQDAVMLPQGKSTRYLIDRENECVPLSPNVFRFWKKGWLDFSSFVSLFRFFVLNRRVAPNLNETLYAYISRIFGKKIADIFLIPFCFGIWGGGAKKLLCRWNLPQFPKFSLKKKQLGLASFEHGMQCLPQGVFAQFQKECQRHGISFSVHFGSSVSQLLSLEERVSLQWHGNSGSCSDAFDVVIYAGQPWQESASFFSDLSEVQQAFDKLKHIPNHSLVVVGIGGVKHPQHVYPSGFGALAHSSSQDLLGVLFIHSTYPKHVPNEGFLYRVLLGGDRNPELAKESEDLLLEKAFSHLKKLGLIEGSELLSFQKVFRYENYVPLFTEFHDTFLTAIWQLEALHPGLFFTGNYLHGVSVSDCLQQAESTAKKVEQFILEQG